MAVDDWIKASFNPGEFLGVSVISSWEVMSYAYAWCTVNGVEEGSQDSPELARSRVSLRQSCGSKQQVIKLPTGMCVCMYVSCMCKQAGS